MLGMIKKDLLMIKSNFKSIIILLLFYMVFIVNNSEMLFLIPLLIFMLMITTFNYDDFNNFHIYASSIASGRVNIVKSKYISAIGLIIISCLILVLSIYIMSIFNNKINFDYCFESLVGSIFSIILISSILFPLIFKFGAEKGRIILFVLVCLFTGLIYLFVDVINSPKISQDILNIINDYGLLLLSLLSIIIITISYLISKKVYLKKEL